MGNIILIGMPGCGKSTVGVVLAKALQKSFVDSDIVIQQEMKMKLSEIIEQYGDEGFRKIENDINAGLSVENTVIATGGSVIYGEGAMAHLREIGTVVYLQLSYPAIEERLGDLHARGVTLLPGQTLLDLYNERIPLYEKYAHVIVHCDGLMLREVVAQLRSQIGE